MTDTTKIVRTNITFRNLEATDALRTYASDKITNCLKKFVHQNTEAHIVLKVEKKSQIAEVSFRADGTDFAAKEDRDDLYAAIDALVDTVMQQLRKHKERLTSHHRAS